MPTPLAQSMVHALVDLAGRLAGVDWLVTGSVARALNGFTTSPNDLDIEVAASDIGTVAEVLGEQSSLSTVGAGRSHRLTTHIEDMTLDVSAGLTLTGPGGVLPPDFALMRDWATDHVIEGTSVRAAPLEEQIVRILVSGDEARRRRFVSESPAGWEARETYVVRRLDAARAAR